MPGIIPAKSEPLLAPSSTLPPPRKLDLYTTAELSSSVEYLRKVYTPPVRGTRRRLRKRVFGPLEVHKTSVGGKEKEEERELVTLRNDTFERAYALRWLTSLIAYLGEIEVEEPGPEFEDEAQDDSEKLLQEAASILATCSGTAGAGTITRTFTFPSPFSHSLSNKDDGITIHLTDAPLENHDYGSVGAQTWGGACVMAELVAEDPRSFGLVPSASTDGEKLRILELGAGTGLVSLTVAKLMSLQPSVQAEVVATDYYPSVLTNLSSNITANLPPSSTPSVSISPQTLDWSLFPISTPSPPLDAAFDVILGADIIYEPQHAIWINSCLEKLLRKPNRQRADYEARFHLIIPLRATHTLESGSIEAVFPYALDDIDGILDDLDHIDNGHIEEQDLDTTESEPSLDSQRELELVIKCKDTFICDAGPGSGEEVEYAYYQIGWGFRRT